MAERGQPAGNLFHLGQIIEIEHEQVVAAGRRARAAPIMLGELQVVPRAGQHPPVPGVTGEAVELGQPEPLAVEADDFIELVGGPRP